MTTIIDGEVAGSENVQQAQETTTSTASNDSKDLMKRTGGRDIQPTTSNNNNNQTTTTTNSGKMNKNDGAISAPAVSKGLNKINQMDSNNEKKSFTQNSPASRKNNEKPQQTSSAKSMAPRPPQHQPSSAAPDSVYKKKTEPTKVSEHRINTKTSAIGTIPQNQGIIPTTPKVSKNANNITKNKPSALAVAPNSSHISKTVASAASLASASKSFVQQQQKQSPKLAVTPGNKTTNILTLTRKPATNNTTITKTTIPSSTIGTKQQQISTAPKATLTTRPPSVVVVGSATTSTASRVAASTITTKNANPGNVMQKQQPRGGTTTTANKKRKGTAGMTTSSNKMARSNSATSTSGATPPPSSMPLADPFVVQAVHDIIGLLQTYGPLTRGQLEYNLPPPPTPSAAAAAAARSGGNSLQWTPNTLSDILELLVATGVISIVHKDGTRSNNDDDSNGTDGCDEAAAKTDEQNILYCALGGVPRPDVILPQQALAKLESATLEWRRSMERIDRLQKALLLQQQHQQQRHQNNNNDDDDDEDEQSQSHTARSVLKEILLQYPEVATDAVYVTALRNVQIDIAAVEKERSANK